MYLRKRNAQTGFTLVELVIVMLIIAILAAIAMPSYRQHVMKVKRADAQTAINTIAQRLERCFTRFSSYADQPIGTNPECNFTGFTTQDGTYAITIGRSNANQSYTVRATPQGAQVNDTRCMWFEVNETGAQSAGGTDPVSKCW